MEFRKPIVEDRHVGELTRIPRIMTEPLGKYREFSICECSIQIAVDPGLGFLVSGRLRFDRHQWAR
jgi:hypothetical protein